MSILWEVHWNYVNILCLIKLSICLFQNDLLFPILLSCDFLMLRLSLVCLMVWIEVLAAQSRLTLRNPTDCSPPASSVHGILQARLLEWVVIAISKGIVSTEAASGSDFSTSLFKLFLAFCHSRIFPVSWTCQVPAWHQLFLQGALISFRGGGHSEGTV